MTSGTSNPPSQSAKSGLRLLKPGEILFNDGEHAESLFIIQKGQIRLFKPKGKGFIEIGVLRAGEVIGEMAFFDEDGSGKKRSCSASALTPVEIIEISFTAFGKTMSSLNPWFKTIINTLAARLRKTNSRVKELEDNQASLAYGGKHAGYEFMKPIEVMRVLGTLFLVFKAHGEVKDQSLSLHRKLLELYTADMYQIMESKLESILKLLQDLDWLQVMDDHDKLPNQLLLKDIDLIRQLFIFYNTERHLPDEKRLRISEKVEQAIGLMLEFLPDNPLIDIPNLRITEDFKPKFTKYYLLNPIMADFKGRSVPFNPLILEEGKGQGLFGEILSKDGQVFIETDLVKIQKLYPIIRFLNALKRSNVEKGSAS